MKRFGVSKAIYNEIPLCIRFKLQLFGRDEKKKKKKDFPNSTIVNI